MLVVLFGVLLVRSALHLRAGLSGLREASFDRPSELTARYARFGVLSACAVGAVLALLAMAERLTAQAVSGVAVIGWLLMAWPLVIQRYFQRRQFAELLAGDRVVHRRAPDAGLTGLGWLLAGHAALVAALVIVAATAAPQGPGRLLVRLLALAGPSVGRSPAELAVAGGIAALELMAAASLIRMTDRRRFAASAYGLVAGGAALAAAWPMMRALDAHHGSMGVAIAWIPTAIQLALPVATLALIRRSVLPAARARYRRTHGAEPGCECT
ncbi:MAG TPA: hypothetical protein VFT22_45680 [Kofleriaceae bacterium]|nr:hypothetical protein [Kofleriaceae bacterium]